MKSRTHAKKSKRYLFAIAIIAFLIAAMQGSVFLAGSVLFETIFLPDPSSTSFV
jgi:hypothetical protein